MLVQQTSTTIGHHCTHQHCENVGINCYQLTSSEKVHFIVKIRTSGSEKKLCTSNQTKWHDTACNTFPRNHSVRFKPHISYYVYIYILYMCVWVYVHMNMKWERDLNEKWSWQWALPWIGCFGLWLQNRLLTLEPARHTTWHSSLKVFVYFAQFFHLLNQYFLHA